RAHRRRRAALRRQHRPARPLHLSPLRPDLRRTGTPRPRRGGAARGGGTAAAGGAASRRAPGSRSWITGRSTTAAAARAGGSAVAHPSPDNGGHMAGLKGTKSFENLKEAFAGESQANRRYLYFARVADIEGLPALAGLFKDTADAETGHAFGHLDFLKEVGDPATGEPIGKTEKNLKAAVAGETYEYTQMYPGMAKTAREEGYAELAEWFETLAKAEKSHAGRFSKGLTQVAGKDPADAISS